MKTYAPICAAAIICALAAVAQHKPGTLTGEVRGLDEESKIVHAIDNGRTYDYRLFVAFAYVQAELENDPFYTNDPTGSHLRGMDRAIVCELRRAMLCEDAPKFVKNELPYTRWWGTNVIQGVPWRWESSHSTNTPYEELRGPGVDWSKVDESDIP